MTDLTKYLALTVLLTCTCPALDGAGKDWKQFSSNSGFSVSYPGSWFRIGISSEDRLSILSSNGGAEAIVIKRGQAEIIVMELKEPANATLSQLINNDLHDEASILSRRTIRNQTSSCSNLTEVISKQEAVPSDDVPIQVPYIINTSFYCEINGRKFRTLLKNWQTDKQQEQYQHIALLIANSLHLTQGD
jgi:hypothetical protein